MAGHVGCFVANRAELYARVLQSHNVGTIVRASTDSVAMDKRSRCSAARAAGLKWQDPYASAAPKSAKGAFVTRNGNERRPDGQLHRALRQKKVSQLCVPSGSRGHGAERKTSAVSGRSLGISRPSLAYVPCVREVQRSRECLGCCCRKSTCVDTAPCALATARCSKCGLKET